MSPSPFFFSTLGRLRGGFFPFFRKSGQPYFRFPPRLIAPGVFFWVPRMTKLPIDEKKRFFLRVWPGKLPPLRRASTFFFVGIKTFFSVSFPRRQLFPPRRKRFYRFFFFSSLRRSFVFFSYAWPVSTLLFFFPPPLPPGRHHRLSPSFSPSFAPPPGLPFFSFKGARAKGLVDFFPPF